MQLGSSFNVSTLTRTIQALVAEHVSARLLILQCVFSVGVCGVTLQECNLSRFRNAIKVVYTYVSLSFSVL